MAEAVCHIERGLPRLLCRSTHPSAPSRALPRPNCHVVMRAVWYLITLPTCQRVTSALYLNCSSGTVLWCTIDKGLRWHSDANAGGTVRHGVTPPTQPITLLPFLVKAYPNNFTSYLFLASLYVASSLLPQYLPAPLTHPLHHPQHLLLCPLQHFVLFFHTTFYLGVFTGQASVTFCKQNVTGCSQANEQKFVPFRMP